MPVRANISSTENRIEWYLREEKPDELFGACLKLVGSHGQPHAPAHQLGEQFGDAGVGLGVGVDMFGVVAHEVSPHQRHVLGRAQRFGQGPFHQPHDAVAHEAAIFVVGVLRQSAQRQRGVACHGQVADGVEQRAVEVENRQFGLHRFLWMRPSTAATASDISGLTMLKMQ